MGGIGFVGNDSRMQEELHEQRTSLLGVYQLLLIESLFVHMKVVE